MPTPARPRQTPVTTAARPAAPRCRGGASSLLRLSQGGASRLPSTSLLNDWVERAARMLMPPSMPNFEHSQLG